MELPTTFNVTPTTIWQLLLLKGKTHQVSRARISAESTLQLDAVLLQTPYLKQYCTHVPAPPQNVTRSCDAFPSLTCLAVYSTSLI